MLQGLDEKIYPGKAKTQVQRPRALFLCGSGESDMSYNREDDEDVEAFDGDSHCESWADSRDIHYKFHKESVESDGYKRARFKLQKLEFCTLFSRWETWDS